MARCQVKGVLLFVFVCCLLKFFGGGDFFFVEYYFQLNIPRAILQAAFRQGMGLGGLSVGFEEM